MKYRSIRFASGFACCALGLLCAVTHAAQTSTPTIPKGAEPRSEDAIQAILRAFETHDVVGMPEAHGNQDLDAFILNLVRHPNFASKVNDIEVECGNSLYQAVLDRYIAGDDVPLTEVRQVWRNTTQPMCGQSGFFSQLFPLIRQINTKLPSAKKLRVLAGEPPIDWSKVTSAEDLERHTRSRDQTYAKVLEEQVLAKGRKALLLFGTAHIQRNGLLVASAEKHRSGSSFIITDYRGFWSGTAWAKQNDQFEARLTSWTVPSLASIQGTWLAALPQEALIRPLGFFGGCGASSPEGAAKLGQVVDAVLYLGPRDLQLHELRPAHVFLDQEYMSELDRRAKIQHGGMRTVGAPSEDSKEGVTEYDPNPFLYNAAREDGYVQRLEQMNAEASKHCGQAAPTGASAAATQDSRTVPQSSPGNQSFGPGGWNPPKDLPAGATFQRTVPSNDASGPRQVSPGDRPTQAPATQTSSAVKPEAVRVSPEILSSYVGKYVPVQPPGVPAPPGLPPIDVAADSTGLTVTFASPERFLPLSATEFFSASNPRSHVTFTKDTQGRVDGFMLTGVDSGLGAPPQIRANRLR